jgi:hypothetical protein
VLTEICAYLRNNFDRDSKGERLPAWTEDIEIRDGELVGYSDRLLPGQYYRIQDSVLNNGVWKYGADYLRDETFSGTVQAMAVPPEVETLGQEISAWITKNAEALNSPYASESFDGYTYTLRSGGTQADGASAGPSWQAQFAARLSPWRKI